MDKRQPTVAAPAPRGMCEKLFHALQTNTTFRPIRRLTLGRQDQTDASAAVDKPRNPPPPPSFNNTLSSGKNNNSLTPARPHKTDAPKTSNHVSPSKPVTTALVDELTPPKKANIVKVENKVKKESKEKDKASPIITKAPPSAPPPVVKIITPPTDTTANKIEPKDSTKILLPTPAPPKGSISPQPTPPAPAATATENPKKNINEKVEDYIQRARGKFRIGSGVGKPPSYNN